MATIDDKVVAMSFESSKFEQGVNKTLASLDKLKKALNFPEAGKGLSRLSDMFKRFNLGHIGQGVDEVSHKLSTLRLIGIGVLSNLAAQAARTGLSFIKSLTIAPITQGFQEYQTQLNAVQTILANTAQAGTKLKDVNAALNQLNHYADKTIYNFTEMTRNIGTFTAAGVDLKTSVASIKGIANLAALSGSNAEQASTAMYQLSQALSAGTVKLQDWNSVVNAGMGGTVFQRALAQNAVHMGTLNKSALKLSGSMKNVTINGESFRQSLASAGPGKTSWLTGKVLTETLKQLSGDMTDAQLKAEGYTDAQVKAIQTQAKLALNAATQVKTLSQLIDTTKEAVGSGWAQTWQIIFGNFGEAKTLFTGLSNAINGFVSANAAARNKVLKDWKALGGRTVLISALKQAFQDLAAVVRPIKQAFQDIFPPVTGKQLYDLTVRFKQLTDRLKPSQQTIDNLRRTFRGLFALLDIGKQIIGGIFGVFARLIGATGAGNGAFLSLTANIGDFLVKVDDALKKGGRLQRFFEGLGNVLAVPLQFLQQVGSALALLFSGFSPGGFSDQMTQMGQAMSPLQKIIQGISDALSNLKDQLGGVKGIFGPVVDAIVKGIQSFGPALGQAISTMSFEPILAVIRTGLLGGIFLLLRNFFGKGSLLQQISKGFAGGIIANISGSFRALEGSMVALQQNIKAKTLKEIAIAVALLVASIVALSFVDPKKLNSAMAAITLVFAQLLGAMKIMDKITASSGFLKLPVAAASLILLAGAIDILTIAVVALSLLSWDQLAKGLTGLTVMLVGLVAATGPLAANSSGMIRAGVGITAIAIGLNIMAAAIAIMGHLSLGSLAKGLIGVSVGLEAIAFSMKVMPKGMILQATALIGIAVALRILGEAVSKFGGMDFGTIAKGMASIGVALLIIGGAMRVMPSNMVLQAAGLLIVAVALQGLVKAIGSLGGMSMEQLAKGLMSLAASLIILAVGLAAMEGGLAGAAALAIAAAGLALLVPALIALGAQSWGSIIKGLIALTAAILLLAVASVALSEAVPFMVAFGVALIAIGAGLALAGAGIFLIGAGLSAIAVSGAAAAGVIVQAFITLQKGIVQNAKLLILGLLEIVQAFADTAPKFVDALIKILGALLDGIVKLMPKVEPAVIALITTLLAVLHAQQGPIIQAGFNLLIALMQGIKRNLPAIVTLAADIIITFLNSLSKQMPRIGKAGGNLVISFVKGIAAYYGTILKAGVNLVVQVLNGIARNISKIITAGASIVLSLVRGVANNVGKLIAAGASAIANFIRGIGNAGSRIVAAGVSAATKLINAIVRGMLRLINVGAQAMIKFLNGVATAINRYEPQLMAAGVRIGVAIVTGMIRGLAQAWPSLASSIMSKVKSLPKAALKALGIRSPSKVFAEIGKNIVLGLQQGISETKGAAEAAAEMSMGVIDSVKSIFEITSPSKVMEKLGREVAAGLANGVKDGAEQDVRQALQDVTALVAQQIADAQQKIRDSKTSLNVAEKGKKLTQAQIAENKKLNATIAEQNVILDRSRKFHALLTAEITKHKGRLVELSKEYAKTSDQLDIATNLFQQYVNQYDDLPEIPTEDDQGNKITDPLAAYIEKLKLQVGDVQAYSAVLAQLKAAGLDDKTYQMLLDAGPAVGMALAQGLLAGGAGAIAQINTLDSQLDTAASGLADNAAKELYDVGEKAIQGFVLGLQQHKDEILKEMNSIADAMVNRIKAKLKIKSPSEVFAEIGTQSMEGMAQGFSDSSAMTDAIDDVAQDALDAMRRNMQGLSAVLDEVDMNPVITPVLDLTQVKAQSQELAALTDVNAVASFGQAVAISSSRAQTEAEQVAVAGGTSVKFEQNNYSPEALTEVEIYRQTKNQLSQIKSALAIA